MNMVAARKNAWAMAIYAACVPLAYLHPAISLTLIFAVASTYFFPGRGVKAA